MQSSSAAPTYTWTLGVTNHTLSSTAETSGLPPTKKEARVFIYRGSRWKQNQSHEVSMQRSSTGIKVQNLWCPNSFKSLMTQLHHTQWSWGVSCIPAGQVAEADAAGFPWDGLHWCAHPTAPPNSTMEQWASDPAAHSAEFQLQGAVRFSSHLYVISGFPFSTCFLKYRVRVSGSVTKISVPAKRKVITPESNPGCNYSQLYCRFHQKSPRQHSPYY